MVRVGAHRVSGALFGVELSFIYLFFAVMMHLSWSVFVLGEGRHCGHKGSCKKPVCVEDAKVQLKTQQNTFI